MSEERFTAIESRLGSIAGRLDSVETKLDGLGVDVREVSHQMRLLHEDTIDRVKATAPDFGPIKREFTKADDSLREEFERRLRPLEREHRRHR